jgi:hypothetical protein
MELDFDNFIYWTSTPVKILNKAWSVSYLLLFHTFKYKMEAFQEKQAS